jgi:ribosomal protein S18 acetylase RimI-like enzyme
LTGRTARRRSYGRPRRVLSDRVGRKLRSTSAARTSVGRVCLSCASWRLLADRLGVPLLVCPHRDTDAMNQAEARERLLVRRLADDEVERVGAVLGLARLHQGNGFYLVAWENDEPLGHAYLALTDPPELQDVQVRPEQRRRGVASAMTSVAEEHALSHGFDRLRLEVSEGNTAAQALYHRCGFADIGAPPRRVHGTIMIRTGPIEVDDTLLTWEKTLARKP